MATERQPLPCPKCGATLAREAHSEGVSLWRCQGCKGMLLEAGVLERVRDTVRADEFFDIGHPKVGRALDAVPVSRCPACGGSMHRHSHPAQPHVFIDSCGDCAAVFLDAGELLDLSNESWLERLWESLTGKLVRR
jgi:Zn-finger nucleic acid-binding protein